MSKKNSVATLDLYCNLMEEIKVRVSSIQLVASNRIAPPFPGPIAREHCFVQLRMICETLAIGCLVIQNQTSDVKAFEKLWNAKDIMDRLEALNPYCFPRSVQIIRHPPGHSVAFDIMADASPALVKKSFLKLYGRCGDALHRGHLRKVASNDPIGPANFQDIGKMVDDIIKLLRAHQISSADQKNHYVCLMENTPGGPCAMITAEAGEPPLSPIS